MSDQIDKINKIEGVIITMEKELEKCQALFLEDDQKISTEEQGQLDLMFLNLNKVVADLFQRKAALPPEIDIAKFNAGTYEKDNYAPTTGGLFDVSLNPSNGRLEILSKMKFDFIDGTAAKFVGHVGESHIWTAAEKKKWQASFIALIEGRWGGKYHFVHPDMPTVTVYVDVEVEHADAGWHYEANVTKIPKGKMEISSVQNFVDPSKTVPGRLKAKLDSEDLAWADKGVTDKQKGGVHEYGHMVGLDDEYPVDGAIAHATMVRDALGTVLLEGKFNDIMSSGNQIKKQHYVTFLQALKDVTNLKKWQFKK